MHFYQLLCLSSLFVGCVGFHTFSLRCIGKLSASSSKPRKLVQLVRPEQLRRPFAKQPTLSPIVSYMATGDRFYPEGGSQDNVHEFPLILEAVKEYRKKVGNLDIPLRFDIPDTPAWPEELRGLKLGRRLVQLQQNHEFFEEQPDLVDQLAEAGWDPRTSKVVDEWQLLLRGLETYKHMHGDLRVPTSFVIPSEPPWDRLVWGARLGKKVAAMRSTSRYVKADPKRKAQVDAMGFEWSVKGPGRKADPDEEKFDNFVWALQLYKDYVGDLSTMLQSYVVPSRDPWPEALHGFTVGYFTKLVRQQGAMVKNRPERVQILEGVGFSCDAVPTQGESNDRQYYIVLEALKVYRQIYGDVLVPQKFVVPAEEPWPEEAWGLRLGTRLINIRSHGLYVSGDEGKRQELTALGFNWGSRARKVVPAVSSAIEEPQTAVSLPESHFAPSEDPQLEEFFATNEKAAEAAATATSVDRSFPRARGPLTDKESLDLAFEQDELEEEAREAREEEEYRRDDAAFREYFDEDDYKVLSLQTREEQRSPTLPFDFSNPDYDDIEDAAHEIRKYMWELENCDDRGIRKHAHHIETDADIVGRLLHHIPSPEGVRYMERMGHRILEFGKHNFENFIEALTIFKAHYGHVDVPVDYCITRDLVPGMMPAPQTPARILDPTEENFDPMLDPETRAFLQTDLAALSSPAPTRDISDSSNSKILLETSATVSRPQYPAHLYGMQLGEGVISVRHGDYDGFEDPPRRKALDELGFDWGNIGVHQRYRFVPLLHGLRKYMAEEEHCTPPSDFVVPRDEAFWPVWMRGMPLGEWAATLRVQQQMVKEYYPERADILNTMEFMWFVPPLPSYPQKYYTPLIQPPKPPR